MQQRQWISRMVAVSLISGGAAFWLIGCGGGSTTSGTTTETIGSAASMTTGFSSTGSSATDSAGKTSSSGTGTSSGGSGGTTEASGASSGSTGSGSGDTSGTPSSTLAADDATATQNENKDTVAVNGILDSVSYLTESEGGRSVSRATGTTYPIITVTRDTNGSVVTVNYGTTPVTTHGGRQVSGVFTITRNRVTKTGNVAFAEVTVNGHTVTGSVTLTNLAVSKDAVSSTQSYDLTIGAVGHSVGTRDVSAVRESRQITVSTGSHTFTPEGTDRTYTIVAANVVMDPLVNKNFVPESGTRTISYPVTMAGETKTVTAIVTYSTDSPKTGVVMVSVNGKEAVPYTLPRFQ